MADEARPTPAREQARKLAEAGEYVGAQAWALVSIADDLAALRRDSDWHRRHAGRQGG